MRKKLTKNEKLFLKYQKAKEQRFKDAENLEKMKKQEKISDYKNSIADKLEKDFKNGDTKSYISFSLSDYDIMDWEKYIEELPLFNSLKIVCETKILYRKPEWGGDYYLIEVSWGLKGK